ncbi:MAG: hypothetical protein Q4Q06_00695 [Bacteroidota bacterium]|nr:hypothetical protein [Bacteroidota bacterium]
MRLRKDKEMNNINKENIYAYLLDLAEERLSIEEENNVLSFIEENKEYKEMLALYDKDFVLKDTSKVVFGNKETLKYKAVFPYWRRVVVTVSCVAAASVLLMILLRPVQKMNNNTTSCKQYIAEQKPLIQPNAKYNIQQAQPIPTNKKQKTIKIKQELVITQDSLLYQNTLANSSQNETIIAKDIEPIIVENNLITENTSSANDTIYIIYAGSKKELSPLQRVSNFVEKHTDWDMMQTVSNIKEMVEEVKEKKEKYFSF